MGSKVPDASLRTDILCIEEHGEICLLLSMMLDSNLVRVSHVKDIGQAAEFLKERCPALVLIENNFFEDAGLSYAEKLKSMYPDTKILMLSAEDGRRKEAAARAGIDAILIKPFTKKELLASIVSLITKH